MTDPKLDKEDARNMADAVADYRKRHVLDAAASPRKCYFCGRWFPLRRLMAWHERRRHW